MLADLMLKLSGISLRPVKIERLTPNRNDLNFGLVN